MKDYLVRGMSMDGFVKVVAIRSTEMVRRGAEIQGTTPNATAAFGRALTAASIDRKSTRLNSSHKRLSRMPSSA